MPYFSVSRRCCFGWDESGCTSPGQTGGPDGKNFGDAFAGHCRSASLSLLVLLGGLLYPPTNHTGLTYRIPRVLQWLAHGHWFWIHTLNYRMNDRACGIEWLSAPLLLFT